MLSPKDRNGFHPIARTMLGVRACAACLATDVRMFSLSSEGLLQAYQLLSGRQVDEGTPQQLCWECAALVNKFNGFRQKCERAYLLLVDICTSNDFSEKNLEDVDRNCHNLCSPCGYSKTISYDLKSSNVISLRHVRKRKTKISRDDVISPEFVTACEVKPFVKVELDVIKQELEDADEKSGSELDSEMPTADLVEYEQSDPKREIKDTSKSSQQTHQRTKDRIAKRKLQAKGSKLKRERKTATVKAKDFGMKEDTLSQEQQQEVLRERQNTDGYIGARLKCTLCYKVFKQRKTFSNHMLLHDPVSGELVCDICKIRYRTRLQLYKHISTHHMKKYSCELCGAVFYNRSSAMKHFAWHKGVVYPCHVCGAIFEQKTSYQNHLRMKHPSEHVCGACGEAFVSKNGLLQHTNKMHSRKSDTGLAAGDGSGRHCAACDVQFSSAAAWTRHILISPKHEHERQALCPLGCETCGETAPDAAALRAHRATHRRVRTCDTTEPITCEICGDLMESSRAYHAHFRRAHPDKTRTHYPAMRSPRMCELCGRVFQDKVHLKLHSYTHTGERPFKCDTCSKAFATTDSLRIHIRSHTKELPYKCDICGQGFSNGGNMQRHKMVHTDAKPYSCATCGKSFKYRGTVKSHTEFVHMKKPWPKRDRSRRDAGRGPRASAAAGSLDAHAQ